MKEKFAAGRPLNEGPVWNLFMQLANAVSYMQFGVRDACRDTGVPHGWIGVVHRDIKLDNIFLCSIPDTNGIRLVLGDFGQAIREDDDGNWGRQYLGGNQATAPPEVDMYGIEAYSYQGDVWAVGCCMSAICRMTSEERFIGDAGPTYSQSLNRAIRRLLQLDPSRRPAMWVFARNMPGWRQQGLSEGPGRRPTW